MYTMNMVYTRLYKSMHTLHTIWQGTKVIRQVCTECSMDAMWQWIQGSDSIGKD